ncbi:hypothetical protein ACMXYV_08605 [Neptuniibacter sp. SY11_33]|uniref:hypothetical protein n=1 Tax=Neptuniibacter sp. SY11_33 TaxID=3398215 RepID=UPI0039F4D7E8
MKKAIFISLAMSLFFVPLVQVLLWEMLVDAKWASELGISGEKVDDHILVNGIDYLRFFRNPQHYFVMNWKMLLTCFLASLTSCIIVLNLSKKNESST